MAVTHTRRWTLAPLVLVILLAFTGRADAGPLVSSASGCGSETLEQPFMRWADPAKYFLVPDGSFTGGGAGWQRSGADIVAENQPHTSHDDGAPAALELKGHDSATSPAVCVGIQHPTMRFFARNTGSLLGTLRVEVLFEDAGGNVRSLPIGLVAGLGGWSPSLPMPVLANLLTLLSNDRTAVAFRFTAQGLGSSWRIDDVYVDPWGK
jgi:hypothetical protein